MSGNNLEQNIRWKIWKHDASTTWSAIESKSNKLFSLSDELGKLLYQRHDLWNKPLPLAVSLASSASNTNSNFVDIDILGGTIRVTSKYAEMIDFIKLEMKNSVPPSESSADVVIEFLSNDIDHRFMRAIDDGGSVRNGSMWRNAWSQDWQGFDSGLPIIPPFKADVYIERFFCLHAAVLAMDSSRGIIVCGDRGAGKSTFSIYATSHFNYHLLSDEVALIEQRTLNTYGLLLPVGVYDTTHEKNRVNPSSIMPIQKTSIKPIILIVLSKGKNINLVEAVNCDQALQWVCPHLRNVGNNLVSDISSLKRLIDNLKVFNLTVNEWPASLVGFEKCLDKIKALCQ